MSQIKLLIADDSAYFRKTISDIVLKDDSIEIVGLAKNGIEAIEFVKKYRPDVLVLDLIMPEMNGLDAFDVIMKDYPLPTIILSAINPQNMAANIQALLMGAFDYIIKPGGMGAKDLPEFKDNLLSKVLLASESQINRIIKQEQVDLTKRTSLRQELTNKAFKFGQYLNRTKNDEEIDEEIEEDDLTQLVKRKIFEDGVIVKEKVQVPFQNTLRQSIIDGIFKSAKTEDSNSSLTTLTGLNGGSSNDTNVIRIIPKKSIMDQKMKTGKMPDMSELVSVEVKVKILNEIDEKPKKKMIVANVDQEIKKKSSLPLAKKKKTKPERINVKDHEESYKKTVVPKIVTPKTKVDTTKSKILTIKRLDQDLSNEKMLRPSRTKKLKTDITLDFAPIKNVNTSSKIIVIGASVGGPKTIRTILGSILKNLKCPILIVQHLNANFVESFASNLDNSCAIKIKVATDYEIIKKETVYIAPGGQHLEISAFKNKPCLKIYTGKPVNFCMPSIDVLFFSAARIFRRRTMGILLTGMGVDGVAGLRAIQKTGGPTIAESEETSILYGMPKIATENGYADYIVPNNKIPLFMNKFGSHEKFREVDI